MQHRIVSAPLNRYVAAVVLPSAITGAVLAASSVGTVPDVPLLYLPVVLIAAMFFGLAPSLVACAAATLELDFFFLHPLHTLTVGRGDDLVTFGTFILVAVVTARLAASARERALDAQRRATESYMLYELGKALTASRDLETVLKAMTSRIVGVFAVDRCAVFIPGPSGEIRLAAETKTGARDRASEAAARYSFLRASGVTVPSESPGIAGREYVPLRVANTTVGVMEVGYKEDGTVLSDDERHVLTLFAAQAALAIDRARGEVERERIHVLEETDRLKSALLSAVSHELRTPLSSIKASADALLLPHAGWTDGEGRELLQTIEGEADRLDRLVGNLLDLSRIEAGVLRPALDWYEIEELAQLIQTGGRAMAGTHEFSVDVDPALTSVRLDLVRIESAVLNLVRNAVAYTPVGTPISVRFCEDCSNLRIEVVDRGPGLSAAQRQLVFDPFFRGRHTDRGPESGMGLGLAICRGIAEAHGGSLTVTETQGGGATFVLELPGSAAPVESRT